MSENTVHQVSSGPYPRVLPKDSVQFDHTGDNIGVSKIDVYHANSFGIRGLRFTYVTRENFEYSTPVYGQALGLHEQVYFLVHKVKIVIPVSLSCFHWRSCLGQHIDL